MAASSSSISLGWWVQWKAAAAWWYRRQLYGNQILVVFVANSSAWKGWCRASVSGLFFDSWSSTSADSTAECHGKSHIQDLPLVSAGAPCKSARHVSKHPRRTSTVMRFAEFLESCSLAQLRLSQSPNLFRDVILLGKEELVFVHCRRLHRIVHEGIQRISMGFNVGVPVCRLVFA